MDINVYSLVFEVLLLPASRADVARDALLRANVEPPPASLARSTRRYAWLAGLLIAEALVAMIVRLGTELVA